MNEKPITRTPELTSEDTEAVDADANDQNPQEESSSQTKANDYKSGDNNETDIQQTAEEPSETKRTSKYVCEIVGCNKQFSYLKCFETHRRNEHSINGNKDSKAETNGAKDDNRNNPDKEWEQFVEKREMDGREKLLCRLCDYGHNLRVVMKQHIINSHLTQKRIRSRPKSYQDYEYWDKIAFNRSGVRISGEPKPEPKPKAKPKAKPSPKTPTKPAPKTPTKTPLKVPIKPAPKSSPKTSPKLVPKLVAKSVAKVSPQKTIVISKKVISPPKLTPPPKMMTPPKPPQPQNIEIIPLEPERQLTPQNQNIRTKVDNEILAKKHLTIDKNKSDVLLSCKGLASMTKVSKYFIKTVINNQKVYKCKFSAKCQFQTKKSQKIAEHINLSHIGVDFKCPKPNCNKVFKNPHSYREHQKNHICGFGSFGYGSKGVIGVCRNENLFKYRERIIIDGKKLYRCKVCFAVTPYFTGIKRHLHSAHICPFRMTRSPTGMSIKQEIMDFELDPEMFKTPFITCDKCNELFTTNEELEKHESLYCRFRDEVLEEVLKNEMAKEVPKPEEESKPQTNGTSTKLKLSEQIRRNVNAINESIAKDLSNDKSQAIDPETEKALEKYIFIKNFEGIEFYLCKYNEEFECNFISRQKDKINDHVLNKHLQNVGFFGTDMLRHSPESPMFPMEIKLEKMEDMEDMDDYNESNAMSMDEYIKPSTSGFQSFQANYSIEQHIEIKSLDGELNYFCVYDTKKCKYYSNDLNEMQSHVKEAHVSFVCDIEDCGKQFKNALALNAHKVNHICGFGIKGRKSSGVCSLENVKKYCGTEKLVNNQMVFPCRWTGCKFVSKTRSNLWSHCHAKHLCPNRELVNGSSKKTSLGRKIKAFIPKTTSSADESCYDSANDSSSQDGSDRPELEVLGTFGTQESLNNFVKYSKEITLNNNKTIFVCLYPNCSVTPRNRSYIPEIYEEYNNSYTTDFKHNMIRHIRRHCGDKPFVCGIDNCEKRFSCSSQFKHHQSTH